MSLAELICAAYVALALPNADIACEHMDTLVEASDRRDVDPVVMTALIFVESRWTPKAVSRSYACGLTQVLPRYSAGYRNRFGKKLTCDELKDPTLSIQRGTHIFSWWLHRRHRGNLARALCGYNKGNRCKGPDPHPTGMRYSRKVRRWTQKLRRKMKWIKARSPYVDVPGCYE